MLRDKIEDSYYKLTSQVDQIRAYVFDVVRSTVPKVCCHARAILVKLGHVGPEAKGRAQEALVNVTYVPSMNSQHSVVFGRFCQGTGVAGWQ